MISKITIQNVKGISNKTFTLNLPPNVPSLFVAPNGFGKSSFALAFNAMNNKRIILPENCYHRGDASLQPLIEVQFNKNGTETYLQADSTKNEISKEFGIYVINNRLKPRAKGGYDKFRPTAIMETPPLTLIDTIPEKASFLYSHKKIKEAWGHAGKAIPNITDLFNNTAFILDIPLYYDKLQKHVQTKTTKIINQFKNEFKQLKGSTGEIIAASLPLVAALENCEAISDVASFIRRVSQDFADKKIESFIIAVILGDHYNSNIDNFKNAVKYSQYLIEKDNYDKLLQSFNSTWKEIRTKKSGKSIIVEFPDAHHISNGQRDILNFVSMLLHAQRKLHKINNILIIDEVFDYLDDANLIAAQYYITKFIKEMEDECKNIYPILLTHLNPRYFINYAFKKPKIVFIDKRSGYQANENFEKLLKKRNEVDCNKKKTLFAKNLEKYFLHYNPDTFDFETEFQTARLPQTWGRDSGKKFVEFINSEANKYKIGRTDYDPLAVCCAVRRKIEEKLYAMLINTDSQQEFIKKHGTSNKLKYVESLNIEVPERYYMLGIIYNEGLHWYENQDNYSPIASKFEHLTIKELVIKALE